MAKGALWRDSSPGVWGVDDGRRARQADGGPPQKKRPPWHQPSPPAPVANKRVLTPAPQVACRSHRHITTTVAGVAGGAAAGRAAMRGGKPTAAGARFVRSPPAPPPRPAPKPRPSGHDPKRAARVACAKVGSAGVVRGGGGGMFVCFGLPIAGAKAVPSQTHTPANAPARRRSSVLMPPTIGAPIAGGSRGGHAGEGGGEKRRCVFCE